MPTSSILNVRTCRWRVLALAFAAAMTALSCALAPSVAVAQEGEAVAYSVDANGVRTDYTSVTDAVRAGWGDGNPTICMATDWDIDSTIEIPDSKKLTIDMQGHTILLDFDKRGAQRIFTLNEYSELTFKSTVTKEITYKGFDSSSGSLKVIDVTTTTGGLVTEGAPTSLEYGSYYPAIWMYNYATLNLDGVTVGGNRSTNGCITMDHNRAHGGTLNMSNGAAIEYNGCAGVKATGDNVHITMDNASISHNRANKAGGGIYFGETGARLEMKNGSKISYNLADVGGGIYFNKSDFELTSEDGTGLISNNKTDHGSADTTKDSQSGGGIHVDQSQRETNKGKIENITISDNYSAYDGGGIELDQENIVIRNCTITGNGCKYEGGGIYDCNDDNVIEGCTITGNWCNGAGKDYEGGGVFVWNDYDLKLSGLCTIEGNTRGKGTGNADDVFLREGTFVDAYIEGSLDKGSRVGVRTGVTTKDRMIARNFNCPTNDCFFTDLEGFYVTYGTDHSGDAWQRKGAKEFAVKVNGKVVNSYRRGESVTVNGDTDASRAFKSWDADGSAGLYPFSDHISDEDLANPVASFTMPQNDVSLVTASVARADAVSLYVDAPVAGSALPSTGTVAWDSGDNEWKQLDGVAVSWLERDGGSWVPAGGAAKYGTDYAAVVSVEQDAGGDRAFAFDIDASRQKAIVGGQDRGVSSASVDASGRLTMQANAVATADPEVEAVDDLSVEVAAGTSGADFLKLIPTAVAARTDAGTAVTLSVAADGVDFSGIVRNGRVVKPAAGAATFALPVSCADGGVTVPAGTTAKLTVTVVDAPVEEVEAPEVSPAAGTYSTTDATVAGEFDNGKLKVTAKCGTAGATIRYALSKYENGAWTKTVGDGEWPASGLLLERAAGKQAGYKVEVWAVKGDSRSEARALTYVIDDVQPVETVKVTAKYTDTGADPDEGTLAKADVEKGRDVSFTATVRPGYSFEKWADASGATIGTGPTLRLEKVSAGTTVTAVYNPVVTALDVVMDLPQDDKALPAGASKVSAKIGASEEYTDVTGYFDKKDGKIEIAWSPAAGEDGTAAHATAYTATMTATLSGSGAKYALSPTAKVLINGNDVDGGAYASEEGGRVSLSVACPVTGPAEYESVDELGTVKLTYREALAAKRSQAAGNGLSDWGLPFTATVNYECGESEVYEITWSDISAFDESDTDGKALTATGTISFKDKGAYVSHVGDTETVTVKVEVDAAETVEAPAASVEPGTHKGAQKVELSCGTEGATIRYTTDGSDPTESSPVYDGSAIEVARSATVRARAYADGMKPSEIAEFAYKIQHKVKFDPAGGSDVEGQWVADGKAASEPAVPAYKGYVFDGWYAEDGGKPVKYDFSTPVTADLKLVAHWTEKKDDDKKGDDTVLHTVTFDAAGGSDVAAQTVADGKCAAEPEAPTRKGYDFTGWTLNDEPYDFSTPVTADLKLTATWKKQESKKDDADKGDDKSDTDTGDNKKGNETKTTTVTTVTTSADSNLAATGDRTPLIVGVLAALGILAAAAGIISKRKKQ